MTRRWIYLCVIAGLLAVAGVGCAVWMATAPQRAVAQIGVSEAFSCDQNLQPGRPPLPDRPAPGTVPAGFMPEVAVVCASDEYPITETGASLGYRQTQYEGDFAEVVRLVNEPSDRGSPLTWTCPSYSVVPIPDFWLLDAQGRAIQPTLRSGECGAPDVTALSVIGSMPIRSSVEYRTTQDEIDLRLRLSSCAPILAPPRLGVMVPGALTMGYNYCRFDVTPDGAVFVGTTYAEFDSDNFALTPEAECTETATRIAATVYVEGTQSDQRQVLVELDGCRRIIADGYAPMQAPEVLLLALS